MPLGFPPQLTWNTRLLACCWLLTRFFNKIPDVDGYAFCGQQAGDDAEPKTVANVGEDDHGHGDEVEMGDQVHREETGVAESGKHSNREEREADYNCCGEEDALPKSKLSFQRFPL